MKYLALVLLLATFALPARAQLQQAPDTPPDRTELSALSVRSVVLSSFDTPLSLVDRTSLGLTPHLDGLRAPAANDEFPATVPTLSAPFVTAPRSRPVGTYRVRPSSVGGWLLRGVAETVCANATNNSTWGAAQCDGIGRRAYSYPRFRSARHK